MMFNLDQITDKVRPVTQQNWKRGPVLDVGDPPPPSMHVCVLCAVQQFQTGIINIELYDYNAFSANELIGQVPPFFCTPHSAPSS